MSVLPTSAASRAAAGCLGLLAAYLAVAFLLHASATVPWEVAIALLLGGSLLIWGRTGGSLRDLLARGGASLTLLLFTGALAVGYGVGTTAGRHVLGLRQLAAPADVSGVVVGVVAAAVVGGLLNALPEEVIFRGVFLRTMLTAWGPRLAVVASGILFSLAHLPNAVLSWELLGAALAVRLVHLAALGALLAWAVLRTGTVWVAIIWHAGTNQGPDVAELLGASAPSLSAAQQAADLVFLVGEAFLLWLLVRFGWSERT